jgi:hypothetical protein
VKSVTWRRAAVVEQLRADVWRYLTQAANPGAPLVAEGAALLDLTESEVRRLGIVAFVMSHEVHDLLMAMPSLIRGLSTTTLHDEEWSVERVRGSINWSRTLGARAATAHPALYVTAPARRAFQTPENEVLVAALDALRAAARHTGWHRSASMGVGSEVRRRESEADRWLRARSLGEIERRPVGARQLARVKSGRSSRRYAPAVAVFQLHRDLVRHVNRGALKDAIEAQGLASRRDDMLLELVCLFAIERALVELAWNVKFPGLIRSGRLIDATKGDERIEVFYQRLPDALRVDTAYESVQAAHGIPTAPLRPDFVLRHVAERKTRWLLVEVKGVERTVARSARAALLDLLGYRWALEVPLSGQAGIYGLGVAWGAELSSAHSEVLLCTPDEIKGALSKVLGRAGTSSG